MATSQKLSRDFHRLGLVLAAIPLVLGLGWTALTPVIYSNMFPHALTGIATTFAATLAVYGISAPWLGRWRLCSISEAMKDGR
jgi:hypothetical protein